MQALETVGTIDKKGHLILSKPLELRNRVVKIIVLIVDDDDTIDNEEWLLALSKKPIYNYLKDDEEDIYTLSDGKPFQQALAITNIQKDSNKLLFTTDIDFERTGLKSNSAIGLHRLTTVTESLILRLLGELPLNYQIDIEKKLKNLFQLS